MRTPNKTTWGGKREKVDYIGARMLKVWGIRGKKRNIVKMGPKSSNEMKNGLGKNFEEGRPKASDEEVERQRSIPGRKLGNGMWPGGLTPKRVVFRGAKWKDVGPTR